MVENLSDSEINYGWSSILTCPFASQLAKSLDRTVVRDPEVGAFTE